MLEVYQYKREQLGSVGVDFYGGRMCFSWGLVVACNCRKPGMWQLRQMPKQPLQGLEVLEKGKTGELEVTGMMAGSSPGESNSGLLQSLHHESSDLFFGPNEHLSYSTSQ
ncbi:unnamed protein product [Eretmochelys imbricata]